MTEREKIYKNECDKLFREFQAFRDSIEEKQSAMPVSKRHIGNDAIDSAKAKYQRDCDAAWARCYSSDNIEEINT